MNQLKTLLLGGAMTMIASSSPLYSTAVFAADQTDPGFSKQVEALKFIPGRGGKWSATPAAVSSPAAAQPATTEAAGVPALAVNADDLPLEAKPGECYARVFVPPSYMTESEQVVVRQASEKVKIIPAEYGTTEEKVLVKEPSEEIRVIPAKYDWTEEKVLVEDASERLVTVPAVFGTVSEEVLVRAAYTTWKKGRGPIEKINEATGEIMCLITVPAEYETVTRTVVEQPEMTRKEIIPAKYRTVKKQVVVEPAKIEKTKIPAEYKTVTKQVLLQPASEQRTKIPAEVQSVSREVKVSDGRMEWRPILCETNATTDVITDIQRALLNAGYNPGPLDGVLGTDTMDAVAKFQNAQGMVTGQLTMETVQALNVSLAQ